MLSTLEMEAINCLRVELAEEVEELPVALRSMFPDLGTDFLYSIFHDVMEISLPFQVGECGKGGSLGSGRSVRRRTRQSSLMNDGEDEDVFGDRSSDGDGEHESPVAKRTRSCQLKSDEEEVGEDDLAGNCVTVLEDAMKEIYEVNKRINQLEANSVQYLPSKIEFSCSDRDEKAANEYCSLVLVRCVVCNKTIDQGGARCHVKHCLGRQSAKKNENKRRDERTKQVTLSDSLEAGTDSLGKVMSEDESGEGIAKASQNSNNRRRGRTVMSNIAPINTKVSEDYSGLPLSPVLHAASTARQGRSSGVRRRRSDPITAPAPGCQQYAPLSLSNGTNDISHAPYQDQMMFGQQTMMEQPLPFPSVPLGHHMGAVMPHQTAPVYQGGRLILNPEQKNFLQSQQLRNHIQFLQQHGMYMMGGGSQPLPATAIPPYHLGVPVGSQPSNVVLGRTVNSGLGMQPGVHQAYQRIVPSANLGLAQEPDGNPKGPSGKPYQP